MPGGNSRAATFLKPYPFYAESGKGCRIIDVDGSERIDFVNNMTSLIHGHSHPHILKTIHEQAEKLIAVAMPTDLEVRLAEELCHRLPSVEQMIFVNSGTEAVMVAIRAARAYTGRNKIAKVEGAYHGAYDDVMVSVGPSADHWGSAEAPKPVPDTAGISEHIFEDTIILPFNDIAATENLLRQYGGGMASVVIDPVVSRMGLVKATPEYLNMIRRVTRELGIVLIFDEVMSFRLSFGGAQSYVDMEPDLTALGKVIGGGFPIGAVGGRKGIMEVFDLTQKSPSLPHSGTYNANPMSMAAGLAALELLQPDDFDRLARLGERLKAGLDSAMQSSGLTGQVIVEGSLLYIHYAEDEATNYRTMLRDELTAKKASFFHRYMLDHGILVAPFGGIILSTPMGVEEIDFLIEQSLGCFQAMAQFRE